MRILLIEDDRPIARGIQSSLEQSGFTVDMVHDGIFAEQALAQNRHELVILDLGLPGIDGMTLLARYRARNRTTPVIILTARDELEDKLSGLNAGADDYLVKPFQLEELYARLRALTRRSQGRVSERLIYRDVHVDPARKEVTRAGEPVALSIHEYRTLVALMERQGRIVTRTQLEERVYGNDGAIESNTIAVYIHQLRRKLGDELIVTVHGFGYRVGEGSA